VARGQPSDGYSADVWSLAVALYILLTATPLYADPSDKVGATHHLTSLLPALPLRDTDPSPDVPPFMSPP
jgi:serine/threonine protein kinase